MELYNGDCLEVMKDIPDGSIDMILADLPYGTSNKIINFLILKYLFYYYAILK